MQDMFYDDETAIALRENGITISSEGSVRVITVIDGEIFEDFIVSEDATDEFIGRIVWNVNKRFLTNGCGVRVEVVNDFQPTWAKSEQGADPFV